MQREQTSHTVFAYCSRNGKIWFSDHPFEESAVRLAAGRLAELKQIVADLGQAAPDGEGHVVSGVAEANSEHEAYAATVRFMDRIDNVMANQ
ncbi:MAG: hypothetical protein CSA70_03560 [Rhodobacterales bacterium]|nr:MAG: hypothetical protein CSA70_03560 [Rhodobacterales bacterium]